MNILFGFAPYIAFFLFMQLVSIDAGFWAALAVAVLNAGRDWARTGSLKILEVGTVLLFAALATLTSVEHWKWTVMAVRLAVDAGLLAIVLVSQAIGRPFNLQYARERVAKQRFVRVSSIVGTEQCDGLPCSGSLITGAP